MRLYQWDGRGLYCPDRRSSHSLAWGCRMNRVIGTLALGTTLSAGLVLGAPLATAPALPATAPALPATAPAMPVPAPAKPTPPRPGVPEPLLSQDELKSLFEQGKFQDVLKQLSRV